MLKRRVPAAILAGLAFCNCSKQVISFELVTSDPGSGAAGSAGRPEADSSIGADSGIGTDSETGPPDVDPLTTCGLPVGQIHPLPTEADFRALFARTWLSCGQPNITHGTNEAGFVAQSTGSYQILVHDSTGHLVPDGRGGTFSVVANAPNVWQVDFAGTVGPLKVATITDSPRRLSMNEMGVFDYVYVPADTTGWIDVATPQPARGTYVPPTTCSVAPGPPLAVSSAAEMRMRLARFWELCSSTGLGPDARGQAGVDIRADGTYNVLVAASTGGIVPATDVQDQGRWDVVSDAPPYQVTFTRDDGSFTPIFVSLTDTPTFLSMASGGVVTHVYIPVD
jgi:hypothetical protein